MSVTNKFRANVGVRDLSIIDESIASNANIKLSKIENNGINTEKPVNYVVHYVKSDNGPPTNPGLTNECCLNIFSNTLYKYDGSSWISTALVDGDRFLFCKDGNTATGCGNNIADNKIYNLNGTWSLNTAVDGISVLNRFSSYNYDLHSTLVFCETEDSWIKTTSAATTVTNEDIDDRVAALLQEGEAIDLTYNDAADTLTISCELAESGISTVNKGVASFSNDSFNSTSGFITLTNVNGGNF